MANTVLGNLQVRLTAVTSQFNKGMGLATRRTRAFSRLMRTDLSRALPLIAGKLARLGLRSVASGFRLLTSLARKLATVLVVTLVAAAGAATAALVLLTKSAFTSIDRLAKSSRIIGITVAELTAFELAAGEAAVEAKTLEKALRNMTRQVNDAAKGTGEAIDALRDLGIDAKRIAQLSIPEQFNAIADALANIKSEGERIQIASDLFGARGLALLNLTSDAVRSASREVEIFGGAISDIDAKNIEKTNDLFGKLRTAIAGIGKQLAARFAPVIGGIAQRMIVLIEGLGGIPAIVDTALAAARPKILAFADSFARVGLFIAQRLSAGFTVAAAAMVGLGDKAVFVKNLIQRGFGIAADTVELLWLSLKISVLGITAAIVKGFDLMIDGLVGSLNLLAKGAEKIASFFSIELDLQITRADNPLTRIADDLVAQTKEVGLRIAEVWDRSLTNALTPDAAVTTGVDDFIKNMGDKLADLAASGATSLATLTAALESALIDAPASERLTALLGELRTALTGVSGTAQQAAVDMEGFGEAAQAAVEKTSGVVQDLQGATSSAVDGIASSLVTAENAFISLRDVAIRALDDIAQALLRGALLRGLSSLFPGSAFIGAVTGIAASAPTLASSAPTLAPAGASAGGDVHINFFGPTSGDDAIREQVIKGLQEAQPAFTNAALSAVHDKAQRDPGFRGAFG